MKITRIDIKGIPKATVLAALYNGAGQNRAADMTPEQAEKILKSVAPRHYVDFCAGKLIKVDLSENDFFDSYLYDREYGAGHAAEVISALREPVDIENDENVY